MKPSLAILVLLAASACHKDHPPSGTTTLVSPGEEPRRALRLHLTEGTSQAVSLKSTIKMNGMGMNRSVNMTMGETMKVTSVAANGDARLDSVIEKVDIEGAPGGGRNLEGMKFHATVSPQGKVTDAGFDGLDPKVKDMAEGMLNQIGTQLPLPVEPIGKGGKWQHSLDVSSMGMKMHVTMDNELLDLQGDKATIKVKVKMDVDAEAMAKKMGGGDVKAGGSGEGQLVVDLGKPRPSGTMGIAMNIDASQGSKSMHMEMKMDMVIESN